MRTMLQIAFRNLREAKRRTFLLGLAVAFVAMLFLMLRAVSSSVSARMVEAATTLSSGHVNVNGWFKAKPKDAIPSITEREKIKNLVKQALPEAVVIDRGRGWARIVSPASSFNAGVTAIVYEQEERFFRSIRMAPESEYRKNGGKETPGDFSELAKPGTLLLFAGQAKKLEVGVGDVVTVVSEARLGPPNTVDLRVAAIASDVGFMSNFSIFLPRSSHLALDRLGENTTGGVMAYLPRAGDAMAAMARLKQALESAGEKVMPHDPNPFFFKFEKVSGEDWLGQRYDLTLWSDDISYVMWINGALDTVSFFIVAVLAVIIGGGILNSMWMAVRERTKEIGTMRAIGTQRGFIVRMFVAESMMLGLIAGAIGALFGFLVLSLLNALHLPITNGGLRLFLMANTLRIDVTPAHFLSTLCLFTFVTGCGALYPAWRASRMRPVEALMQTK